MYDATVRAMPNGRFGGPEEVAKIVAFLASPSASIITGSNVVADNGYTKRVQY
jgi:NAD(P)-dependent dehydrogenase (short-subunit alcohol dehydrogenase family)